MLRSILKVLVLDAKDRHWQKKAKKYRKAVGEGKTKTVQILMKQSAKTQTINFVTLNFGNLIGLNYLGK